MPIPDHFLGFWRALDDLLADVRPTWWGAVVTDPRFPGVWDANYARVDIGGELRAAEIEAALVPALMGSGSTVMHVVIFRPEGSTGLIAELSTQGHRLGWDLLMDLVGDPPTGGTERRADVEELDPDEELWSRVGASFELFGIDEGVGAQLLGLEREALVPGGKRWFGVRDGRGVLVALASLILLEDVGYVDHVVTFPSWRRSGYASAFTSRIAREARDAGAHHVSLLVDPDAPATVALYERLGFRGSGKLASTKGLLPQPGGAS